MKTKNFVFLIVLMTSGILSAQVTVEGEQGYFQLTGSFSSFREELKSINNENYLQLDFEGCRQTGMPGEPVLPVFSRLFSLPARGILEISGEEIEYREYQLSYPILPAGLEDDPDLSYPVSDNWIPETNLVISDPVIMRGERFCQVSLMPVQYNPATNRIRTISRFDLTFEIDPGQTKNQLSRTVPISSGSFSGFTDLIQGNSRSNSNNAASAYMFIVPDNYAVFLEPLLNWKRQLGFDTHVALLSETGYQSDEIKEYIQLAYDNWETPPEFVVLVGDINGNITVPSFYVEGTLTPYDVSDHSYSLLEGDDYFPDVFVGRLSVRDVTELQTVVNKIISYEQSPYSGQEWITRSIMVSYIMQGPHFPYFSARETKMAVRDKLLGFTHTVVDTCISPYQPGDYHLEEMINQGCSFVNYRGAGSYNYWSGGNGPIFGVENVLNLNNGFMMPFITSITCGGGDFAAPENSRCLGEVWLSAGTPGTPQGAIGFIGPSERDTKTAFNNALDMGIYQGITQEGMYRAGEMMLRGKMELYLNYPFGHEWGNSYNSDQFYFYVYNLLGDPGLSIWTDTPSEIEFEIVNLYQEGSNYLEIQVDANSENFSDFLIAVTDQEQLYRTAYCDEIGNAIIPLELDQGDYTVTVSSYGFLPASQPLNVDQTTSLKLQSQQFSGEILPGAEVVLDIELINQSDSVFTDINAVLTAESEFLETVIDSCFIPLLEPGAASSCQFVFTVSPVWMNGIEDGFELVLISSDNSWEFFIPLTYTAPDLIVTEMSVNSTPGYLQPGSSAEINFNLHNQGDSDTGDFTVEIHSLSSFIEISQPLLNYQTIEPGSYNYGNEDLSVITGDFYPGETAVFSLVVFRNGFQVQEIGFETEIGNLGAQSPTICSYGYCAVESRDSEDFDPPQYNWIEIDPEKGGDGFLIEPGHQTSDGYTTIIELPFSFSYFGTFYDQISVCSNGWLSMGNVSQVFHRNRNIPSGSGPPAMVAPFWDDLFDGQVYIKYDSDMNYLVVQWSDFKSTFAPDLNQTFQVVLYDPRHYSTSNGDGRIMFQYQEVHDIDQEDNFATAGLENHEQTSGLLLSFAGITPVSFHNLTSETAVLFTPRSSSVIPLLAADHSELELVLEQNTWTQRTINLYNSGNQDLPLDFTLSIGNFSRSPEKQISGRDMSSDFIFNSSSPYIPFIENELLFYLVHLPEDEEDVYGVSMDFPPGLEILSASDITSLIWDAQTGDGITVNWGFENGEILSQPGVHPFDVNVIIDGSHDGPIDIPWTITGDGSGDEPHIVTGSLTINPSDENYIWIEYPNGYETLVYGTEETMLWQSYGDIEELDLQFSSDGGETYQTIMSGIENNGSTDFSVPEVISGNCVFKLLSVEPSVFDVTDYPISITGLNITYPETGSIVQYNSQDSVLWTDLGGSQTVDLHLSIDAGYSWQIIAEGISNNGKFLYTVPGPVSDRCLIRLISENENIITQTGYFTISDVPVEWLTCNVYQGTIQGTEYFPLLLSFSTTSLETGYYQAFLNLNSSLGQKLNVPVEMEVIPPGELPSVHRLFQNRPNPFNSETAIRFFIQDQMYVKLRIFNLKGQLLKTLVNESLSGGYHLIIWDGKDNLGRKVNSGIYFYSLESKGKSSARKMVLIK